MQGCGGGASGEDSEDDRCATAPLSPSFGDVVARCHLHHHPGEPSTTCAGDEAGSLEP